MNKVHRRQTLRDTRRIKALEERLDAIVEESRRLRAQLAELTSGTQSKALLRDARHAWYEFRYNPDEPVN